MARYETERAAKEYLAGKITAQAELEGAPLTEVEQKMLYFSETGWTLPKMMEVNAEFERDYGNDEYEQKIAGLAGRIEETNRAKGGDDEAAWDEAVEKLSEGDHYLLVLMNPKLAGRGSTIRPPGDFLKLVPTGLACSFGLLILFALYAYFVKQ
jgi:hypothetical protein